MDNPQPDEEVVLQQHFHNLCAEKCKLLSAIELTTREGRRVQKELHRILDFVAEIVPDNYLDCFESDTGDEKINWFEESDEEVMRQEGLRESNKIDELKMQFFSLRKRYTSPRRRSLSPDRKITNLKGRKVHKFLPTRDDGSLELPLVIGRGVHRATLIKIGQITLNKKFSNGEFIYPIGFEIKRKYSSFSDKSKKTIYFCSIKKEYLQDQDQAQAQDQDRDQDTLIPIFEISYFQNVDEFDDISTTPSIPKVISSGNSLNDVWEKFKSQFDEPIRNDLVEDFPIPESFFGLDYENLVKYLKNSPSLIL